MYNGKIIGASMVYGHFSLREAMHHMKENGMDEMEVTIGFSPHFLHLKYMTEREMDEKRKRHVNVGCLLMRSTLGWALNLTTKKIAGLLT